MKKWAIVIAVVLSVMVGLVIAWSEEKEDLTQNTKILEVKFNSLQSEISHLAMLVSILQERTTNKINEREKVKAEYDSTMKRLQQIQVEETKKAKEKVNQK